MTKLERSWKPETRDQPPAGPTLCQLGFELRSSFDIRHSTLVIHRGARLPSPWVLSKLARMPTLLEKIEADAAVRLPLPPDRRPSNELARYKGFLKVEAHRLKMLHRAGGGGREICQARAAV